VRRFAGRRRSTRDSGRGWVLPCGKRFFRPCETSFAATWKGRPGDRQSTVATFLKRFPSHRRRPKGQQHGPCVMGIFGARDLTKAELIPASLQSGTQPIPAVKFRRGGVAFDAMRTEQYGQAFRRGTRTRRKLRSNRVESWRRVVERLYPCKGPRRRRPRSDRFRDLIKNVSSATTAEGKLSLPGDKYRRFFSRSRANWGEHRLATRGEEGNWRRVVIEKPFGPRPGVERSSEQGQDQ